MRWLLLFSLLIATAPASAQESNVDRAHDTKEPKLPVIDENACPFEGCTFGAWTVTKESILYSTWQEGRHQIGKLEADAKVTGLTGVHITRKPDRILVKKAIADLSVAPGDIILRYMYIGEGFANIWTKGAWHKEYDCTFVSERSGEGCLRDCAAVVVDDGVKEWWVEVKTGDGKIGWVLQADNFAGMDSLARLKAPAAAHSIASFSCSVWEGPRCSTGSAAPPKGLLWLGTIYGLAADDRPQDFGIAGFLCCHGKHVAVEQCEVGLLSWSNGSDRALFAQGPG
jgi:hypothetical protein